MRSPDKKRKKRSFEAHGTTTEPPLQQQNDTEINLESISSKLLCFVIGEVVGINRMLPSTNYRLMSVPVIKMFASSSPIIHGKSVLQRVKSWHNGEYLIGIGLLPSTKDDPLPSTKDDRLLPSTKDDPLLPSTKDDRLLPSTKDDRLLPSTKKNILYVVFHEAERGFILPDGDRIMLRYAIRRKQSHLKLDTMPSTSLMKSRSPHFNPIVVEIKGLIYVLSARHGPLPCSPRPDDEIVFQVYYPEEGGKWKALPPPPFMRGLSGVPYSRYLKHVVLGNKLYLSSMSASSVFCTSTLEWEPCKLFGVKGCWGNPFPRGSNLLVVYDDFLLCATTCGRTTEVVAHKVSCEGVVQSEQKLLSLLDYNVDLCYLTDLGGGHICFMFTMLDVEYKGSISPGIKFFLFKVSKSLDGQTLNWTGQENVLESSTVAIENVAQEAVDLGYRYTQCFNVTNFFAY